VLCPRVFGLFEPNVGDWSAVDAAVRKEVGPPEGLDTLRLSRSFSFGGEGESSMMRTHPEESPPDAF